MSPTKSWKIQTPTETRTPTQALLSVTADRKADALTITPRFSLSLSSPRVITNWKRLFVSSPVNCVCTTVGYHRLYVKETEDLAVRPCEKLCCVCAQVEMLGPALLGVVCTLLLSGTDQCIYLPSNCISLHRFKCASILTGWTDSFPRVIKIIIIIIINLIYIAQFDTNGILTALYIVITYIQMQYVHV